MKERTVKTKQFHVYKTHVHHSLCSNIELFSNVDVHQKPDRFCCESSFLSLIKENNFLEMRVLNNYMLQRDGIRYRLIYIVT